MYRLRSGSSHGRFDNLPVALGILLLPWIGAADEAAFRMVNQTEFLKTVGYNISEPFRVFRLHDGYWREIGLQAQGLLRVRSVAPGRDVDHRYSEFTIVEEVFQDAAAAERRSDARQRRRMGASIAYLKTHGFERTFRIDRTVYIVKTDVASFRSELERLASALQQSLASELAVR